MLRPVGVVIGNACVGLHDILCCMNEYFYFLCLLRRSLTKIFLVCMKSPIKWDFSCILGMDMFEWGKKAQL